MKRLNYRMIALLYCIGLSCLLNSCRLISEDRPQSIEKRPLNVNLINTVDNNALTYKAKYGFDHEISGNIIAKFPHFDLTLFSKQSLPTENAFVYVYELTSKNGFDKIHITCDPREAEKQHFSLNDLHFYYHSNRKGAINIYMPQQLLALHRTQNSRP